jgi:5'-nucleotidase
MRALITNDDGIGSAGILVLAKTAVEAGLDVTVAAPGWDSSGASASLTSVESDGRLLVEERRLDDLDDVKGFAVEAAPAYIVRAGITGAFGPPPDVVLSGMNHGRNTGYAVLHSGTVGAALTAMTHGRLAMAVSVDSPTPTQWGTAAAVAAVALRWLLDVESPVVLNVNVPDVVGEQLGGFRRAHLAKFGAVQTTLTETGSGYVKFEYSDVDAKYEEGTDAALLEAGIATFTPLQPVCEASSVDTTSLENVPATASQR